jgi:ABC-2 type transport system ATP-binding protein
MKLRVEDLSKSYKSSNGVVESCKKINFEACDGEIIGLLGANGAGKTTLIKMICNLVNPTSGSIYLDGKDMSHNKRIAQKKIGVVLEGARNIYNFLTVQENIEYFSFLNGFSKKETAEKANDMILLKLTKEISKINFRRIFLCPNENTAQNGCWQGYESI